MEKCVVHYPDSEISRELIPDKLQTFETLLNKPRK